MCHARFNEPEFSDLLLGTMEIHEEARGKLTQKVKGSYMGRLMTWKNGFAVRGVMGRLWLQISSGGGAECGV